MVLLMLRIYFLVFILTDNWTAKGQFNSPKINLYVCLTDLPGFTRSVYKRDHALITPESHVFSPLPDWYVLFCFEFTVGQFRLLAGLIIQI